MTVKLITGSEQRWTAADIAEIFATNENDDARITGYAAVFYDGTERTEYRFTGKIKRSRTTPAEEFDIYERILPGAFDGAIGVVDTACLFNHDRNILLGRHSAGTLQLVVDPRGLRFEALPLQATETLKVISYIQRREVRGCSFSFRDVTDEMVEEERNGKTVYVRNIRKIGKLYDVGPVTFPAYEDTDCFVRDLSDIKIPDTSSRARILDLEIKMKEIEILRDKALT